MSKKGGIQKLHELEKEIRCSAAAAYSETGTALASGSTLANLIDKVELAGAQMEQALNAAKRIREMLKDE